DPIRQKEFYEFSAFFRNTTQAPLDGNIQDTPPVAVIPGKNDMERWHDVAAAIAPARANVVQQRQAAREPFAAWLRERGIDRSPVEKSAELLAITVPPEALPKGVTAGDGPTPEIKGIHFEGKAVMTVPVPADLASDQPFTIAAWVLAAGSEQPLAL